MYWPALMNKKEVQSFLGFTNFYWHFIKDFSKCAWLLFNLDQEWCKMALGNGWTISIQ
jgi:hypothetical protein